MTDEVTAQPNTQPIQYGEILENAYEEVAALVEKVDQELTDREEAIAQAQADLDSKQVEFNKLIGQRTTKPEDSKSSTKRGYSASYSRTSYRTQDSPEQFRMRDFMQSFNTETDAYFVEELIKIKAKGTMSHCLGMLVVKGAEDYTPSETEAQDCAVKAMVESTLTYTQFESEKTADYIRKIDSQRDLDAEQSKFE